MTVNPALIPVFIMYLLLIPGVIHYIRRKLKSKSKNSVTVIVKGLCTTIILAAGLAGFIYTSEQHNIYALLIIAGLALGLAGDIAICYDFLAGMVFFAIGHICYISAFIIISQTPLWALPVFMVLYIFAVIVYRKSGMVAGRMIIPMVVYCTVLTAMLSFAASAAISSQAGSAGWVLLAGAALFTFADSLLALCSFKTRKLRMKRVKRIRLGIVSTSSYFAGQSLIAMSLYLL